MLQVPAVRVLEPTRQDQPRRQRHNGYDCLPPSPSSTAGVRNVSPMIRWDGTPYDNMARDVSFQIQLLQVNSVLRRGPKLSLRQTLRRERLLNAHSMLTGTEEARMERFLNDS